MLKAWRALSIQEAMRQSDLRAEGDRRGVGYWLRAVCLVLVIPALLVLAWAAFGLQGYQNDPQSKPFQTWPAGVGTLALAAALAWICVRRPSDPLQRWTAALALIVFATTWAGVLT